MRDYWPSDWPEGVVVGMPWVPLPAGDFPCHRVSPDGYWCTRPAGHSGSHLAGGYQRSNGLCPVFEVWEDDA